MRQRYAGATAKASITYGVPGIRKKKEKGMIIIYACSSLLSLSQIFGQLQIKEGITKELLTLNLLPHLLLQPKVQECLRGYPLLACLSPYLREEVFRHSTIYLARADIYLDVHLFHIVLIVSSAMGIPECPELFK
jgi:hypothetical protein